MKKTSPTPLAFHGIVIRTGDPGTLARRIGRTLGWPVLARSAAEIVLGAGPELFFILRASGSEDRRSSRDRRTATAVEEIHLAVKDLRLSRRVAAPDALGGDSGSIPLASRGMPGLALHVREFRRAPRGKRKKKRPRT